MTCFVYFSPLVSVSENWISELITTSFFSAPTAASNCSFMILVRRTLSGNETAPIPSLEKKLFGVLVRQNHLPFTRSKASIPATGTLQRKKNNNTIETWLVKQSQRREQVDHYWCYNYSIFFFWGHFPTIYLCLKKCVVRYYNLEHGASLIAR